MVLRIILFFSLIISVSFAQNSGWTPSFENAVRELNPKDKKMFDQTLVSCAAYQKRSIKKFEFTPHEANVFLGTAGDSNYMAEAVFSQGWEEGTRVFRQTGGTGMYLHELLNSDGFMLAMKTCFNSDSARENLYVAELILIDAAVKGVYIAASYVTIKYLLARRWGVALVMSAIILPMPGDAQKPRELGFIEKLEEEKEYIEQQVRRFIKNKSTGLP
jgi:hypothetical protein